MRQTHDFCKGCGEWPVLYLDNRGLKSVCTCTTLYDERKQYFVVTSHRHWPEAAQCISCGLSYEAHPNDECEQFDNERK